MKDYIKKHKILFIILLILFIILLILPFIVKFNNKESSTDYVNYYGMILTSIFSSIVTITIFYFTLNENRRQLEEERSMHTRAVFISKLKKINKGNIFNAMGVDYAITHIIDNNMNIIFIFIENNKITILNSKEKIKEYQRLNHEERILYFNNTSRDIFDYELIIINDNPAPNSTLLINDKEININDLFLKNKKVTFRIVIEFANDINLNKEKILTFGILYYDASMISKYKQEEQLIINDNREGPKHVNINSSKSLSTPKRL